MVEPKLGERVRGVYETVKARGQQHKRNIYFTKLRRGTLSASPTRLDLLSDKEQITIIVEPDDFASAIVVQTQVYALGEETRYLQFVATYQKSSSASGGGLDNNRPIHVTVLDGKRPLAEMRFLEDRFSPSMGAPPYKPLESMLVLVGRTGSEDYLKLVDSGQQISPLRTESGAGYRIPVRAGPLTAAGNIAVDQDFSDLVARVEAALATS